MVSAIDFNNMFSFPRPPETQIGAGQFADLIVPGGKRALITDVYIENLGGGISTLRILEQRSPNSFEVRYTFRTESHKITNVNFTTGLKLGDEAPILKIRVENFSGSQAPILPRISGIFVD